MTLVRWRPTLAPRSLFSDLDRWFGEFFDRSPLPPYLWDEATEWPRVDVRDDDGEVVVRAEIPGVRKEDLEVTVTEDALTIRGESKQEEEEGGKDKGYHRRELRYGRFARTIPLPTAVLAEKAKAKHSEGVLEVRLPKAEEEERRGTRIEIK